MPPLDIPDNISDKLYQSAIKPGVVIRFYDTTAGKEKRIIILGTCKNSILVCYVRINSKINPNIFITQNQIDSQYKIESNGNSFLDHDSFVDCTQLEECEIDKIVTYIKSRKNPILGTLKQNDLDSVITIVVQAETSVPSTLRKFNLL